MSRGTNPGTQSRGKTEHAGEKGVAFQWGRVLGSRVDILGVSCFCAPITVRSFLGPLVFEQGGSPGPGL